MAAGKPHGLRPFGLEPQRILRLQKLHIIVGQDTDSESTPFGAAMPWIVKLDKEQDFIGKWALEHFSEHGAGVALVGFSMPNGDVPTEGAVVLDAEGTPAGPGDQLAPLAGARPHHRDGVGARGASRRTGLRSPSPTRAARSPPRSRPSRSMTPTGRCCAREPRFPAGWVRRFPTDAVAHSPMERLARAAGARFEVRDGWNVAVRVPGAGGTGALRPRRHGELGRRLATWPRSSSRAPPRPSTPPRAPSCPSAPRCARTTPGGAG